MSNTEKMSMPSARAEKFLKNLIDSQKSLMKQRRTGGSESGSSQGNPSDNSALVSLGNNSFGFNFDSDERCSNNEGSKNGSSNGGDSNNEDSDGNEKQIMAEKPASSSFHSGAAKNSTVAVTVTTASTTNNNATDSASHSGMDEIATHSSSSNKRGRKLTYNPRDLQTQISSLTASSGFDGNNNNEKILKTLLSQTRTSETTGNEAEANDAANKMEALARSIPSHCSRSNEERKRKATDTSSNNNTNDDSDSEGGYNTDDDERKKFIGNKKRSTSKKDPALNEMKREERNQREKERSFRISKQITELRDLLSTGGVAITKGTKSSVLTEAANYIRILQQRQYRSEIERHQLVQQMQLIGSGSHGPQAAQAVRHFAAQNGVWSLGNFGGVPPKSAMTPFYQAPRKSTSSSMTTAVPSTQPQSNVSSENKICPSEYQCIFNACGVGIAIASMGGAFIECNELFCKLSNYTKQEVCALTIFNLTARQDLQQAFDQISQLISPPIADGVTVESAPDMPASATTTNQEQSPIVLRGTMKNRDDLGLSISLVRGDDDIAKCFVVTIVKNPISPFDTRKPKPVSYESIQLLSSQGKNDESIEMTPAFTSG